MVKHLDPIFKTLAPGRGDIERTPERDKMPGTSEEGYLHCGPAGAGHFVKMVHNGIEYGIMQAYAEGFDIFKNANSKELPEEHRFELNLPDIAEVWRRGSVIGSWLLDLMAMALVEDPTWSITRVSSRIRARAAGRFRRLEAAVSAEVLASALFSASVRASSTPLPKRYCRPCVTSSADTWSHPRAASPATFPPVHNLVGVVYRARSVSEGMANSLAHATGSLDWNTSIGSPCCSTTYWMAFSTSVIRHRNRVLPPSVQRLRRSASKPASFNRRVQ